MVNLLVWGFDDIYTDCPVAPTVTESSFMLTQFNEITPRGHEAGLLELWAENVKPSSILGSAGNLNWLQGNRLNCFWNICSPP